MGKPLRVFIGYDPREEIAFHVLNRSIQKRATLPVSVTQVALPQLKSEYWRSEDAKQSNAFSFSRFLVPYLAGYDGPALWLDCDMLCLGDIAELFRQYDERYAVQVVKQRHIPSERVKYLGQEQTIYHRKNWSSVMLFNTGHIASKTLGPVTINKMTGLWLHQFAWCTDEQIGDLPQEWNFLVGTKAIETGDILPKVLHYTTGGPWFEEYRGVDKIATDLWDAELAEMLEVQRWRDKMAGVR